MIVKNKNLKTELTKKIIQLRGAVSFLGEKKSWWNTKFHESSSLDFLVYIFPKSVNAQFLCSNIAIRRIVDNKVGANYYHLFRLPVSYEELIKNKAKLHYSDILQDEENSIKTLKKIAMNLTSDGNGGPKNIGSAEQVDNDLLQRFAAEYLSAFENSFQVHPYLI